MILALKVLITQVWAGRRGETLSKQVSLTLMSTAIDLLKKNKEVVNSS